MSMNGLFEGIAALRRLRGGHALGRAVRLALRPNGLALARGYL
ncbi:MAG: hypothetical protein JWP38_341 [Herbaspirillum sp.]|nr:hypothetical protein [Herbaspirillum sp.]